MEEEIVFMKIIIREARLDEINTLRSFEQGIIEFERPFAPNLREDPISYYDIEALIRNDDAHVIVAEHDNTIIGSGYALIKKSKPYNKPDIYAYLGFMYVVPEYRGKGVNGMIIDTIIQWSKERSVTEFQLEVYAGNDIALNAYKKRSFKPCLVQMRMNTDEF